MIYDRIPISPTVTLLLLSVPAVYVRWKENHYQLIPFATRFQLLSPVMHVWTDSPLEETFHVCQCVMEMPSDDPYRLSGCAHFRGFTRWGDTLAIVYDSEQESRLYGYYPIPRLDPFRDAVIFTLVKDEMKRHGLRMEASA